MPRRRGAEPSLNEPNTRPRTAGVITRGADVRQKRQKQEQAARQGRAPLDDDTLSVVFSFLEPAEQRRLRLVCKQFRDVGRLALSSATFRMGKGKTWRDVDQQLNVWSNVRHLVVHFARGAAPRDYAVIATRRITSLGIS